MNFPTSIMTNQETISTNDPVATKIDEMCAFLDSIIEETGTDTADISLWRCNHSTTVDTDNLSATMSPEDMCPDQESNSVQFWKLGDDEHNDFLSFDYIEMYPLLDLDLSLDADVKPSTYSAKIDELQLEIEETAWESLREGY